MEQDLAERSLARMLLLGMIGISLLIALALGAHFFFAQQADFNSTSEALRQRALAEQQTLLQRQLESIKQDLDYRRRSAELVLRAEIQQRVEHAYSIASSLYQSNRGRKGCCSQH